MTILFIVLSLIVFVRTISYGFYELQKENNRLGGTAVIILGILGLIVSNIIFLIK